MITSGAQARCERPSRRHGPWIRGPRRLAARETRDMRDDATATAGPVDLKLLLDQYNKQISYTRDMGQKIIVMILAYLTAYVSYPTLRDDEARHWVWFTLAHVCIILFVIVLQWSNY